LEKLELIIQNRNTIYAPCAFEDVSWDIERKGVPGKLTFKILKDEVLNISEGNAVRVKLGDIGFFYWFVFTKKSDKENTISITAYDQLRYFKNKDTYVYTNKKASEVIKLLSNDFRLNIGQIEDTSYVIASRVEDNKTLFDIVQNALDLTFDNTRKMYVLYDEFGKITLKNIESMKIGLVIDEETGENFNYESSIDSYTYNKIKLSYDNEKTGKREIYIAQDSSNMNEWGVLQYFEKIDEKANGQFKADNLLKLYNNKKRKIEIKNAIGDIKVRAGVSVIVSLKLEDMTVQQFMLVEKVKHTFNNNEHRMDLTLRGGDFIV